MQNNIYFLNKMPTLWSLEVNSETSKSEGKITNICFNLLRNKNYLNKINSRNSTLHKFHFKVYLE